MVTINIGDIVIPKKMKLMFFDIKFYSIRVFLIFQKTERQIYIKFNLPIMNSQMNFRFYWSGCAKEFYIFFH